MSILSEEQLIDLRLQFYREPLGKSVVEAIFTLTAKGCDRDVLRAYAWRAAGYRAGNWGLARRGAPNTIRRMKAFRRHLLKLAEEAMQLRAIWGFRGRLLDAGCLRIPEELKDIEERLSRVEVSGYADWHPQREAILDLLDHVRSSTGRYHYAEVSTLINSDIAWRAIKKGEPIPDLRNDVDSLKMIVQRWRRERRVNLSRLTRTRSCRRSQ